MNQYQARKAYESGAISYSQFTSVLLTSHDPIKVSVLFTNHQLRFSIIPNLYGR